MKTNAVQTPEDNHKKLNEQCRLLLRYPMLSIIRGALNLRSRLVLNQGYSGWRWAAAVVGVQAMATGLAVGGAAICYGAPAALAALCGGLIVLVATLFVATVTLGSPVDASANRALKRFYFGALGKYAIVVIGLVAVFSATTTLREERNALVLFATLFLVQSAYWVAPALLQKVISEK